MIFNYSMIVFMFGSVSMVIFKIETILLKKENNLKIMTNVIKLLRN